MKKILFLLFAVLFLAQFLQAQNLPLQIGDKDSSASWSPRNDLILTSTGQDNALRLWDVSTGKVIWKKDVGFLQDKTEGYVIETDAWSNDQKFILTGTSNGKIQLWETATGKLLWNIRAHSDTIMAIAVNPSARIFISTADAGDLKSELKVWNLADGKLIKDLSANQKAISAVRFIDDEKFQTGNSLAQINTWSLEGFRQVSTKQLAPCGFVDKKYNQFVYSPNLNFLAAQCQKQLVVLNTNTQKAFRRIPKEELYKKANFSRDEKFLFLPDTVDSRLFDISANKIKEFDDFDDGVLNSDGSLIAANSYSTNGTQIFDTKTGKRQIWLVGHPGIIKSLVFTSDGKRFASGSNDRIVRVWDTNTKNILLALSGHTDDIESVEFSSDDKTITSKSEKETIIWNAENGAKIKETKVENRFSSDKSKAISPSEKLALVEEYDKPFKLIDAKTEETIKEFVYIDQLDNLIFTPNENYFLAKPWWSGWQLWSVESGKPIREFDIGYSYHNRVAFHPDGKTFITGGEGQNILMFNLETGEMLWSLFPIDHEEFEQKKAWEARRVGLIKRKEEYAARADVDNQERAKKITGKFSHYGDAESFWDQKIAESGAANKSKLKLPKEKAKVAWFTLTNKSDLPISIDTNSLIFNPKCQGLCGGAEISLRYVMELKSGETNVNGFDMYSKTILPPKTTVYFSVALEHFAESEAIYLGFTFQKDNADDEHSNDYGTEQKFYLRESDLPE